jgi:hypothetical protein
MLLLKRQVVAVTEKEIGWIFGPHPISQNPSSEKASFSKEKRQKQEHSFMEPSQNLRKELSDGEPVEMTAT